MSKRESEVEGFLVKLIQSFVWFETSIPSHRASRGGAGTVVIGQETGAVARRKKRKSCLATNLGDCGLHLDK